MTDAAAADTPAPPAKKKDKHLYQIDLVRLVTFGGVILDHVMLSVTAPTNVAAGAVEMFLRYTRYGFFALTGFVLTYQYRKRDLKATEFWRRRYKLIGLPFVTWSLFYWFYTRYKFGGVDAITNAWNSFDAVERSVKSIVYDLITGHAAYHLYFLSVSMQIYLVFPLVLWVLKRSCGYHRYLLAVSLVVQMVVMYMMVRPPVSFLTWGIQGEIWSHLVVTIIPYQFFIFAGCVAAMHFEAFQGFVKRWRRQLITGGLVVMLATWVYYLYVVDHGEDLFRATNVFMLHNMWAFIAIIIILYSLGTIWQERRTPGSIPDRLMRTASDRSFGIYLAHALALYALLPQIATTSLPAVPRVIIAYLATVALTVFIVETLRRSPISLITTGRNRIDWRVQNAGRSTAVGLMGIVIGVIVRLGFEMWAGNLIAATGAFLVFSMALVYWRQVREGKVAEETV
ncbi:acyltransferase [Gordonia sp. NB41Y]|uniref:acyltransferase family protein n=1 Tax=Gordonia sp. NB41Y TaxID=875808 RepID=UPI0006B234D0|nr:acyltransferase [Gordonia sp. NB41Y]KOY49067.1 acyltransferase [Gordonia sp. NB41Y]WLP89394.1 acyltransferase [Gordonia sp. NB41Y]